VEKGRRGKRSTCHTRRGEHGGKARTGGGGAHRGWKRDREQYKKGRGLSAEFKKFFPRGGRKSEWGPRGVEESRKHGKKEKHQEGGDPVKSRCKGVWSRRKGLDRGEKKNLIALLQRRGD